MLEVRKAKNLIITDYEWYNVSKISYMIGAIAEYSPHFLVLSEDYPNPKDRSINKTWLKSSNCALL